PAAGVSLRSGATYLIGGGLGGLGKAAARRLIRRGARHLLLLGRVSLPPREAWGSLAGEDGPLALKVADLRELEAEGASVRYAAVDVADERALAAVLERHRQEGRPPFRGVIHAAGAAQPGRLLEETDPSVLRKILPGKVEGAWHLHRLLKDEDLDFFVMFSSAASTLGFLGQGQAVYAAANAALDALSCLRRSEGRPASSIGWGPWAEAGLAVRQARLDRLAGAGVEGLSTVAALAALEGLMTAEIPVSLAVSLDWNRLPAFFTGVASSPFFQKLVPKEGGQGTDRPGSRLRLISDPDLCLQGLSDHLRRRLAEVLGLARDDLDPGVSLSSLGLDSLVAVEIRKRLEKDLGVSLPLQDLFRGGSIDQLARKMWDLLRQDPLDPPPDLPSHEAAPAGMIPLSSSQSTLWFTERMHPGSAGYNVPLLIRLRRAPDAGALARSFQVLVDRHASLRTIYRQEGEHSGQIIQPHVPVRMVRVDASRWDRSEMDQRLAAELQRPFRLEEGPLFRITLFSMGPSEAVLLVVIHHIAIDFRSMEILLDDLRVLYPALA
ncbi:MAG: KR domain-containing protein, partial [Acidobacteriota bacterium]